MLLMAVFHLEEFWPIAPGRSFYISARESMNYLISDLLDCVSDEEDHIQEA